MTSPIPESLPDGFVWGAATASYQIEGATREDGRGESIWDRFSATPGNVRNDETGEIACDFYHRYPADIGLMRELGLDAFRFSVAWPRVLPEGRGAVDERGLDFYDRLVDALLEAGIEPFVTLYHWDLPQALEDEGGWTARGTVDAFCAYADVVVRRLGDRVGRWITHNEPWVAAWQGYGFGTHAPGGRSERAAVAAAHHLLLSHGRAVELMREIVPGAEIGITLNLDHIYPASDSDVDRRAARWEDGHHNRWFLDPIFRGEYPADMLEEWRAIMPALEAGDLETISTPIDFLGVNNYTSPTVGAGEDGTRARHVGKPGVGRTDMGWEITPDGFNEVLVRVAREYDPRAIYVTENGAAFPDVRGHDGRIEDTERQQFLGAYISAAARAAAEGVPLRGYFVWSLLDNFEWAWGYWKRFGLIYVDFPTQERIPKGSYYWYRDLIAAQRRVTSGSEEAA